ncbi:hypothetical protein BZA77DRAFT_360349 [Pyronema omphalodes]|nr:hypothetical protein BZA77DRAFT_360349 [Pyronema omphalodes]
MAEVIGTDLSRIQSDWVPANCRFGVDDAMLEWTFKDDSFDFIDCRNIASGVSDCSHLATQLMRCVIPGSYVELCKYSIRCNYDYGTIKTDNGAKIDTAYLRESIIKMSRPPPVLASMKMLLE